jgi:hypothetical protein
MNDANTLRMLVRRVAKEVEKAADRVSVNDMIDICGYVRNSHQGSLCFFCSNHDLCCCLISASMCFHLYAFVWLYMLQWVVEDG